MHFEEFVWLVDATEDAVLVAWGGFFFRREGPDHRWRLVPAAEVDPGRTFTVGARSQPYGAAAVTVHDEDGAVIGEARTDEVNHAWVTGLRPDTRYRYRVVVDGAQWAAGERRDWGAATGGGFDLAPRGREYDTTFRTRPRPDVDSPLSLAVLGDVGVGALESSAASERQRRIAELLDRLVTDGEVRMMITTGDNVYDGGNVDADWYGAWFQPYRYVLARVPVYATVGNHDSGETEQSDDRAVLDGNLHIDERFAAAGTRRASTGDGLFYRCAFGAEVEIVCIDTSEGLGGPHPHYYEQPEIQEFLREVLATGPERPRWRIAFCHHPPYCAGPKHDNAEPVQRWVGPLLRDGGVDVLFSGHEHNFQHCVVDGVSYFVSGAAGELTEEPPTRFAEGRTRAWAAQGHLLHVRIGQDRMTVTPLSGLDPDGTPRTMTVSAPDGGAADTPFVVLPSR